MDLDDLQEHIEKSIENAVKEKYIKIEEAYIDKLRKELVNTKSEIVKELIDSITVTVNQTPDAIKPNIQINIIKNKL